MKYIVAARNSPLSMSQVREVEREFKLFYPHIEFEPYYVKTKGDKDLQTSLRFLEKTNFFTEEIDNLLLEKKCRIAIHSAKDLPEPLPKGLSLIALTKGVDSSDSLVLREPYDLYTLPKGAVIATSSIRREEAIKKLRSDVILTDIRGTIGQRLQKLYDKEVDGVIVAEAALIRLQLQHLHRMKLPIETAPLQGKLAILAREDDNEMRLLFSCLDNRKTISSLYLGLDLPYQSFQDRRLIHKPIITVQPRPKEELESSFHNLPLATHIVLTSKAAVNLFFHSLPLFKIPLAFLQSKIFVAIGKATANAIYSHGFTADIIAQEETSEGVVEELKTIGKACFFWPHSSGSRSIISDFLQNTGSRVLDCILYDSIPIKEFDLPPSSLFEEIIFTSPSTVDAFFHHFPKYNEKKILTSIGPVTESRLAKYIVN